jgi:hypothetical protein
MYWYPRKSHWVRSVAVAAAVTGISLVAQAPGSSAHASTSGAGSVQSAAVNGCSPSYPYPFSFTDSNVVTVTDLTVCTNTYQAAATIQNILEDTSSPTHKAIIACAEAAYSIGQNLYIENQSQNTQSQLSTGLGIFQDSAKCAKAVDEAQEAEARYEIPKVTLTLRDIPHEIRPGAEWEIMDRLGAMAKLLERLHVPE